MSLTSLAENENLRLQKLHEHCVLDTPPEPVYDDIVLLAAQICGAPFALIALVDSDREWFKATFGLTARETPRHGGFGACAMLQPDVTIVPDTHTDGRFSANPLVASHPQIRFYAGVAVQTSSGEKLGALCVLDTVVRELDTLQIEALRALGRQVSMALQFRSKTLLPAEFPTKGNRPESAMHLPFGWQTALLQDSDAVVIATDSLGVIVFFNRTAQSMLGYNETETAGKHIAPLLFDADELAAESKGEPAIAVEPGFATLINTGQREWTCLSKDGRRIPVSLSITPIRDTAEKITGYLIIAIDIASLKAAEAKMKMSERFSHSILDALSKQFCVLGEDGTILEVNKPWLDFEREQGTGKQPLEIGQNYPALLDAGLANDRGGKTFAEGIRSVLNGSAADFTLEYSYRTRSGQLWFVGKVLSFPDRELGRVIVTHENISEHKHLEHRFRQAVESAPNAIVMVDKSCTILMVNLQAETSFGYPRRELIGQPVEMLVPKRFREAHAGFRRYYFTAPVSRPMGAGRDLYGLRKDGTEFPVEIGLSTLDCDEETLVLSSIIDITERKRLERRFRQAVESAPNAIVMVNESGTILMVNLQTELFFGYSRREMVGQPVEMLTPERFRKAHAGFRQAYLAAPVSRPMGAGRELYGLRKDGTEFPVEIGLGLIDDENGIIVLSSIVDITERKNASDKLKEALNEKEMLLKEVYHRVKNNLQVVSSLINLQAANVKNEATVDLLQQSADRIKAMALLHEKLYQSKDLARIDFNAYIRSLVDHLLFGYGTQSGKIGIDLKIDGVFLDVDTAIPCGLIVNELLSNSLKHGFPGDRSGKISVTFQHLQDEYVLTISDNGIGFPSSLDFKKSASLGLQLVETLTNQLMGSIEMEGSNGSTFTIRFTAIP